MLIVYSTAPWLLTADRVRALVMPFLAAGGRVDAAVGNESRRQASGQIMCLEQLIDAAACHLFMVGR